MGLLNNSANKLVGQLQSAQKESADQVKQLNSELHQLAELINQVLDAQNEIIKAQITTYQCLCEMADHFDVKIPTPLTKMEIE